jgi:hypothetical protein
MAAANPLWGAPRIHGELLKLGIDIAERTVARLMLKHRPTPLRRLIGSIRRECLNQVIVLGERHLTNIAR